MEETVGKIQISLAAARVNAGMTQKDIADKLGVSKNTIINWEKGKVKPSPANLIALSTVYRMPVDYIFLPNKSTLSEF